MHADAGPGLEFRHRWRPLWTEYVLICTALALVVQQAYATRGGAALPLRASVAFGAALALTARERFPLSVGVPALAAMVAQNQMAPMTVLLFHLAARGRTRAAAAYGSLAALAPWLWRPPIHGPVEPRYSPGLVFALAITAGLWTASRRRLAASRAVEAELHAEQARLAERARISAEMHDVLAHRLSLLALHAGVLAMQTETLPPPALERIALLRATAAQALADLRDLLGALRTDLPGDPRKERGPAVQDLSALLAEADAAGQRIEAEIGGEAGSAPASHRLAVHRLVQEGLTNARKHAGGAPVRLHVHYGSPATSVELVNGPGRPPYPPSATIGYGLVGLSERVSGLSGHLHHGPSPDGGWRLSARLPLSPDPASSLQRQPIPGSETS
ncbi:histidine kinase [Streptomyces sp. NBC_00433]